MDTSELEEALVDIEIIQSDMKDIREDMQGAFQTIQKVVLVVGMSVVFCAVVSGLSLISRVRLAPTAPRRSMDFDPVCWNMQHHRCVKVWTPWTSANLLAEDDNAVCVLHLCNGLVPSIMGPWRRWSSRQRRL